MAIEVIMEYDREILIAILIYHQRKDIGHCACGWSILGASHAEHVANVYEIEMELVEHFKK